MHRHGAESSITTVGIECRGGIGWSADLVMDDSSEKSRNAALSSTRGHSNVAKFSFELSNVKLPKIAYPVVFPGHVPSSKHEIFSADYKINAKLNRNTFSESSQVAGNDEVEAMFPYALLRDQAIEQMHPIPLEEMDLLRVLAELLHGHCEATALQATHESTKIVGGKSDLLPVFRSLLTRSFSEVRQEGIKEIEPLIAAINEGQDLDEENFEILANFVHPLALCFASDECK
jgi:hypothetical protein